MPSLNLLPAAASAAPLHWHLLPLLSTTTSWIAHVLRALARSLPLHCWHKLCFPYPPTCGGLTGGDLAPTIDATPPQRRHSASLDGFCSAYSSLLPHCTLPNSAVCHNWYVPLPPAGPFRFHSPVPPTLPSCINYRAGWCLLCLRLLPPLNLAKPHAAPMATLHFLQPSAPSPHLLPYIGSSGPCPTTCLARAHSHRTHAALQALITERQHHATKHDLLGLADGDSGRERRRGEVGWTTTVSGRRVFFCLLFHPPSWFFLLLICMPSSLAAFPHCLSPDHLPLGQEVHTTQYTFLCLYTCMPPIVFSSSLVHATTATLNQVLPLPHCQNCCRLFSPVAHLPPRLLDTIQEETGWTSPVSKP